MIEIGRICTKTAGRDSGKKCIIIDIIDKNYVTIDGLTRRKKCNVKHLEPLKEKLDIKKDADHSTIVSEFKKLGIEIKDSTPKESKERPKKQKVNKKKSEEKTDKKSKKDSKEEKSKKTSKENSKTKKTSKK